MLPTRWLARLETRAYLRVGSDENGKPAWGSIPVVWHRPLPAGAVVKEAAIGREKIGSKYRWNLTLTIKYEEEKQIVNDGVVAVDLLCRRMCHSIPVRD